MGFCSFLTWILAS